MPIGPFKDFAACVAAQRRKGKSEESAKKICGAIQAQSEGKMKFKRFIPITKIDEDKRMVYGFASTPDLDSDGEIIELGALEKALPEYMKFPTIREMHQHKAIGTTKEAQIVNGERKGLFIGAKIIADDAWNLVKEGVYKAFSIGGNVIEQVENSIKELELVEISLVDVPSNKAAIIEVWKKDKKVDKLVKAFVQIHKDSDSVLMLSNLLAHLKDVKFMLEIRKKPTAQMTKMIEQVKKMIIKEAEEKEPKPQKIQNTEKIAKLVEGLAKIHKHRGGVRSL